MNISLIVTSYNRRKLFATSWDSIAGQMIPGDEIVVVEDGADNGWDGMLEKFGVDFQVIRTGNSKYRSCSFSKNIAVKKAKNPLLIINDPEVYHVTPCIPVIKTRLVMEPRIFLVPGTLLSARFENDTWQNANKTEHSMAPFVAGVMKEEIEKVGGWDERFIYWGNDDNDLMYRLGLNG